MARNWGLVSHSRLTKMHQVSNLDDKVVMQISRRIFERIKENSSRYGDRETYDDCFTRLLDSYEEQHK